jgi:O-acetylserine/cysteine efflux transporter
VPISEKSCCALPYDLVNTGRTSVPLAGLLQLGLSVILLGSAWPITKIALAGGAAPLWFAVGRAAISCLAAMTTLCLLRRLRLPRRADLPALLSVGLLQLAGFFAFTHAAIAWLPAGRAVILSNVTTIFVVPLSLLVLHEAIPPRRWLGTALGLAGVAALIGPWSIDWSQRDVVIGHLFLLGAALCYALTLIMLRYCPPRLTMLELLPWCFGAATLGLLPLALWHGGAVGAWSAQSLWSLIFIGSVAGPVGTWSIMQAAAVLPAMVASVGVLLTPAAGLAISTLWLGEAFGLDLQIGSVLILGGVACVAWPRRRRA